MRRTDREVTDENKIDNIIEKCNCCRIGLYYSEKSQVYIVPLNFGYVKKEEQKIFYFHCAKEGRKIELIQKNPKAGFELDTNYQLKEAEKACGYSAYFQSIIGNGEIHFVTNNEEKVIGLNSIMKHNTGKDNWNFDEKMLNSVCVFKLVIEVLSCKENMK